MGQFMLAFSIIVFACFFCREYREKFELLTIRYSGGEEVLLDVSGQDGSEAFEDVGHSDEAREILDGLLVGTLKRLVC